MPTFSKDERLCSKIVIEKVYNEGKTLKRYPFLLKFMEHTFDDGEPLKIVFTVPKRRIKSAVKRNRVKRQIREVYRLQKEELKRELKSSNKSLALFLIYTGESKSDFNLLKNKMGQLLAELKKEL